MFIHSFFLYVREQVYDIISVTSLYHICVCVIFVIGAACFPMLYILYTSVSLFDIFCRINVVIWLENTRFLYFEN